MKYIILIGLVMSLVGCSDGCKNVLDKNTQEKAFKECVQSASISRNSGTRLSQIIRHCEYLAYEVSRAKVCEKTK